MPEETDTRREELLRWLQLDAGIAVDQLTTASADASFRRYFRVHCGEQSFIAMDAPPELEDSEPFVRIATWLAEIGLNSPRVLAENLESGFLLLTDLGDRQFLHTLTSAPHRAADLYQDAMRALNTLQDHGASYQPRLPVFNSSLLGDEMALFRDWLCTTHLQLQFTGSDEDRWNDTCNFLIESALAQPRVFVHRDYHSRNQMHCEHDNPGMLDFQDAVNGPLTYDLVSLLKDCYVRRPAAEVEKHAISFYGLVRDRL
ncbi:MAG: phosphotransferase, partial [Woeseia sp.]